MSFDPVAFGIAMGDIVREAVEPLQARIQQLEEECKRLRAETYEEHSSLKTAISAIPAARDGKDCDMADVKAMIAEAVKSIPPVEPSKGCLLYTSPSPRD